MRLKLNSVLARGKIFISMFGFCLSAAHQPPFPTVDAGGLKGISKNNFGNAFPLGNNIYFPFMDSSMVAVHYIHNSECILRSNLLLLANLSISSRNFSTIIYLTKTTELIRKPLIS